METISSAITSRALVAGKTYAFVSALVFDGNDPRGRAGVLDLGQGLARLFGLGLLVGSHDVPRHRSLSLPSFADLG